MAQKLDPATIIAIRNKLNLTQTKFAHLLGMSLGAYQKIENGVSAYRLIHKLAAERVALDEAARHDDYGLLAEPVLQNVLKLYGGQLPSTVGGTRRTFLRHCDLLRSTFGIIADQGFYMSDVFVPTNADVTFETLPKFARLISDPGIESQKLVPNICAIRIQVLGEPKSVKAEVLKDTQSDIIKILDELSNHNEESVNSAPAKARATYKL